MNGTTPLSLQELDQRIAIVRDNIRQLISRRPPSRALRTKIATPTVSRNRAKSSIGC